MRQLQRLQTLVLVLLVGCGSESEPPATQVTDADCQLESFCKTIGACRASADGQYCVVGSSADCASSEACAELGDCTLDRSFGCEPDSCQATSNADCAQSALCTNLGSCCLRFFDEQQCLACGGC